MTLNSLEEARVARFRHKEGGGSDYRIEMGEGGSKTAIFANGTSLVLRKPYSAETISRNRIRREEERRRSRESLERRLKEAAVRDPEGQKGIYAEMARELKVNRTARRRMSRL